MFIFLFYFGESENSLRLIDWKSRICESTDCINDATTGHIIGIPWSSHRQV